MTRADDGETEATLPSSPATSTANEGEISPLRPRISRGNTLVDHQSQPDPQFVPQRESSVPFTGPPSQYASPFEGTTDGEAERVTQDASADQPETYKPVAWTAGASDTSTSGPEGSDEAHDRGPYTCESPVQYDSGDECEAEPTDSKQDSMRRSSTTATDATLVGPSSEAPHPADFKPDEDKDGDLSS